VFGSRFNLGGRKQQVAAERCRVKSFTKYHIYIYIYTVFGEDYES
jgi:hypothetical protein